MSEFRLYNTMSRTVEPFQPLDGETVRFYSCGPTVYDPAHVGNFRTFLFNDLLRRALRLEGWKVVQVQNLTDVDDKIIRRAEATGKTIAEVTEPVTEIFHADRRYLRIEDAEAYPKATTHIPEMIALVQRLLDKGVAYKAEDGSIYFAIDRFPGYGKLSRLDAREVRSGARVAQDDYTKENAQDFALWKAAKPEDEVTGAAWDAPFGRGRPGWHLECSAMAMKYLGETLDIHCGGIDLVFPHHEDEIAQSEAATGKTFSRFWCHGEFLQIDGTKMSKRLGNITTVKDLRERGVSAAALRHFVFSTHYRKQMNLSGAGLEASLGAMSGGGERAHRLETARGGTLGGFRGALRDDLNAPEAVAALFTFLQRANAELDRRGGDTPALAEARRVFGLMDSVLDIQPRATRVVVGASRVEPEVAALEGVGASERERMTWAVGRLQERLSARGRRDFLASGGVRGEGGGGGFGGEGTGAGGQPGGWGVG
ncbi:MAG TPA: cysteine--tRNA ligase, partial [Gemmatimonadaceae bacterium]|nr:cysteine--tRNA ligase [Gemmatimonadaceae bacterium]